MRDRVEVLRQIGVHHVSVASAEQRVHLLDRVGPAPSRPVAMGRRVEVRLEDRFQHQLGGGLHHPVPDRRDAEGTFAASGLRDHHPSHRCGPIGPCNKVLPEAGEPPVQPCRLDLPEGHSVHPRRARVRTGQRIGVTPECPRGRSCRRAGRSGTPAPPSPCNTASSEGSGSSRVLPGSSPITRPRRVESAPEVRALPSTGVTRLPQYYGPVRLPPGPAPEAPLRPRPSSNAGLPRYPITFPACHAHYPGGSDGCSCRLLPHPCSLPRNSGGSASTTSLSRPAQASLTLRPAGSLNRPRRPLSRGFGPASYPAEPLVSYQTYRQLSGWILPPLVNRAIGAH